MLQQITWKDYWTFIVITTAIYWFIIITIFYKTELLALAKGKKRQVTAAGDSLLQAGESGKKLFTHKQPALFDQPDLVEDLIQDGEPAEIDLSAIAQTVALDIKDQIEVAADKELVKEELLFALQRIIKDCAQLKGTSFQKEINHLIISDCETLCSIHLSAEDVNTLWVS